MLKAVHRRINANRKPCQLPLMSDCSLAVLWSFFAFFQRTTKERP